ncbi:type II toxin-antitoxin system antitoxin SocA domain-containing protein [endosymbiont GvMRE of Glomus versiforme]|uniref:type II toxin-antitoxin system antitoxin SocA domain-containing protein n=1 Tax=endosymbiont GvMRE of Glomus versiforme TaxID=2039283 RepID=UPI000ECCD7D6|nr:type II toxin-antitoxin system antitoxin SocA domain-containing protein [endosymbiont GvMRE of Glomus versiforme]RHZ36228.1 Phage-Associated Protein [endosymbiont GvMRE of Glomus versiforme]
MNQLVSAVEVAKLLLSYDPEREYFSDNKLISVEEDEVEPTQGNFRINKMLHICQMLHYAKYREPLFFEDLRAYKRGAIVYPIYKGFFNLYRQMLKPEEIQLNPKKKSFISKIYHYFKNYQNEQLEIFSHDDISWKQTWQRENDDDRMIINEENKKFYRDLLSHIVREVEFYQDAPIMNIN